MSWMFYACTNLTHLDLSGFDTARVTDMGSMLGNCKEHHDLDLSSFDTSQLELVKWMCDNCESLEEWAIPKTWPAKKAGAIPKPTSTRNERWSQRDVRWMSEDEIRSRGRTADTFMSLPSAE